MILLQGAVFKEVSRGLGGAYYFHIWLAPLFIILLPFNLARPIQLLAAFVFGLLIDQFYGTTGLYASACVFMAYVRPVVLLWLEPREGYNVKKALTMSNYGVQWFLQYTGILLFVHLFFYYAVEAFTFYYIKEILLRTLSSFVISYVVINMAAFIIQPKS